MDGMLAYCPACDDIRPHALADAGSCLCACGRVEMLMRAMDPAAWATTTVAAAI